MNIQNNTLDRGLKANPRTVDRSNTGKAASIKIAANIATTPTNLFGIERNIA